MLTYGTKGSTAKEWAAIQGDPFRKWCEAGKSANHRHALSIGVYITVRDACEDRDLRLRRLGWELCR